MKKMNFKLKSLVVVSSIMLSQAAFADSVELIKNGAFNGDLATVDQTWTGGNKARLNDIKAEGDQGITFYDNFHGDQAGGGGWIEQTIDTVPGKYYLFTFEHNAQNIKGTDYQKRLAVGVDVGTLYNVHRAYQEYTANGAFSSYGSWRVTNTDWQNATHVIKAASSKTKVSIMDTSYDGGGSMINIDNVSVKAYDFDGDKWCDLPVPTDFEENAEFIDGCTRFGGEVDTDAKVPNAPTADRDNDGLTDVVEAALGTNPDKADSDNDGLNDKVEVGADVTKPLNEDGDAVIDALESNTADKDSDGAVDQKDPENTNPCVPVKISSCNDAVDTDKDGLSDAEEALLKTDPAKTDTDNDGLTDYEEVKGLDDASTPAKPNGVTDPLNANSPCRTNCDVDSDNDGLTDSEEAKLGTDPQKADTDGDTLTDGAEVNTHKTDPNKADTDNDGLTDAAEVNTHKTDPNKADTDGDKINDGSEVENNTDPLNPNDPAAPSPEASTGSLNVFGGSNPAWMMLVMFGLLLTRKRK